MSEATAIEHSRVYHYVESGLDNVYLLNGFEIRQTPYGSSVSIFNVEGLHRSIAACLVEKPAPLTGMEFKFLRVELDLSQRSMGVMCGLRERQIRNIEKSPKVGNPHDTIIRVVYKQRYGEDANYEEFANLIREFQEFDKRETELLLESSSSGWGRTSQEPDNSNQEQLAFG